jgi:cytochrome c oxidase subunit 2
LLWLFSVQRATSDPYRDIEIEVVGSEFVFYFRYPGVDRVLFSEDDRYGSGTLFVPEGANVHLKLTSLDYIYTLEIPARDVYEMAAPDLVFNAHVQASTSQTYDLLGSQMCGYDHPGLLGKMIVQTADDFDRSMTTLSKQSLILK